jgi:hypothetical protein
MLRRLLQNGFAEEAWDILLVENGNGLGQRPGIQTSNTLIINCKNNTRCYYLYNLFLTFFNGTSPLPKLIG